MPVKFVERRTPSSAWRRGAPSLWPAKYSRDALNLALKRATPDECVQGYMNLDAS